MQKSYSRSSSATRSLAYARPPSTASKDSLPFGGSPRKASTFSMPAASRSPKSARRSAMVLPEHVTCARTSRPSSVLMRFATSTLRVRVEPPAPYVTETKAGSNGRSVSIVRMSAASPSSVFGGKNSKENTGCPDASRSVMRIRRVFGESGRLPKTGDDAATDECPAVDHHEQQQLARERDHRGAEHEHPEPHQDGRDGQIDRDERHVERDADGKRVAQLADEERGNQNRRGHARHVLARRAAGKPREKRRVGAPRLSQHERTQRLRRAGQERGLRQLSVSVGLECLARDTVDRRRHDDEGQDQCETGQHGVGRQ